MDPARRKTTVVSSSGVVIEESGPSELLGVPVWARFSYRGGSDRVMFDVDLHSHYGSLKSSWGCGIGHVMNTYNMLDAVSKMLVSIVYTGWFPTKEEVGRDLHFYPKELRKLPDHSALRRVKFGGRYYLGPPSVEYIVKNLVHESSFFEEYNSEADFIVTNLPQGMDTNAKRNEMIDSVQRSIDTWRGIPAMNAWLIGTLGHRNFASIAEEEID